jgi:hypothetical protein
MAGVTTIFMRSLIGFPSWASRPIVLSRLLSRSGCIRIPSFLAPPTDRTATLPPRQRDFRPHCCGLISMSVQVDHLSAEPITGQPGVIWWLRCHTDHRTESRNQLRQSQRLIAWRTDIRRWFIQSFHLSDGEQVSSTGSSARTLIAVDELRQLYNYPSLPSSLKP